MSFHLTISDWILQAVTMLANMIGTILFIIKYPAIPDLVPMHYDFHGNVTATGNKSELIILLVISWIVAISITILIHFPKLWNVPRGRSQAGQLKIYKIAGKMMEVLNFLCVLTFQYACLSPAFGIDKLMWPIIVILVVILTISFVGIILMYRVK